jgi:hypothetical protein
MYLYDAAFPYIVVMMSTVCSIVLVLGGAYTAYSWASGPTDMNNTKAANLYAGIWVFVGSSMAAMGVLWIAKKILTY